MVKTQGRPALLIYKKWSGQRDSNPRPSAWEANALPTELCPLALKRKILEATGFVK